MYGGLLPSTEGMKSTVRLPKNGFSKVGRASILEQRLRALVAAGMETSTLKIHNYNKMSSTSMKPSTLKNSDLTSGQT